MIAVKPSATRVFLPVVWHLGFTLSKRSDIFWHSKVTHPRRRRRRHHHHYATFRYSPK